MTLVSLPLVAVLVLVIGALVAATSRGPVFFKQERVGLGGSRFRMVKFRTMLVDAEERLRRDPALWNDYVRNDFKLPNGRDPRVTPVGRFLRRSSLDELPQLFNVLLGHMSLVGPRPHALVMEEDILVRYPHAARRLDMRPGMTGLAQVRGLRGPTRRKDDITHRIEADVEYVENWTLRRDLGILAMTPGAWLLGRNAH
jgi:putative colanic acid biosynthesis UDP-glucose lipid carrier transferase